MPGSRRPRIGVYGSYGGWNLGDEAILHALVGQLRKSADVDITVFTRSERHTLELHGVDRAVEVQAMTRDEADGALDGLDLLVLGGGGILFDGEVEVYLREVALAHKRNLPVMVYAIGAGPLRDAASRKLVVEQLEQVRLLTVRDRDALRTLQEAGVQRDIVLTADPALTLEPEPLPDDALAREGLDDSQRLVGLSVREPGAAAPEMSVEHYHSLLANTADFMIDRLEARVVFVPMERKNDTKQAHAVMSQMHYPERASIIAGDYTPGQMLTLIGRMQFCLGMRLHFLLFAARQAVPFVALPYAGKVLGLLHELDMPMPPLADVTAGRLLAHVDHSWDNQDAIRARIAERMPDLVARAGKTHEMLMEVLDELWPSSRQRAKGA